MARGVFGILDALNNAMAFERPQPACQYVAGGACVTGYLVESMNAQGHLPKGQQRPPLSSTSSPAAMKHALGASLAVSVGVMTYLL